MGVQKSVLLILLSLAINLCIHVHDIAYFDNGEHVLQIQANINNYTKVTNITTSL